MRKRLTCCDTLVSFQVLPVLSWETPSFTSVLCDPLAVLSDPPAVLCDPSDMLLSPTLAWQASKVALKSSAVSLVLNLG